MTLLITVFLLVFMTELISWIGQTVLFDLVRVHSGHRVRQRTHFRDCPVTESIPQAYAVHIRVFDSAAETRQRTLKTEILAAKAELLQTSAQDQFAKWAKLRRNVDKGLAELEKLSEWPTFIFADLACEFSRSHSALPDSQLASRKMAFSLTFHTLLWILTTGMQLAIGWYYRRAAVFYLPPGWLGPLEWWMALPFAPQGPFCIS
jgi:tail-anchored protein insertion receptor